MNQLRFSEEHEWIRVEAAEGETPEIGLIGISDYAQEQLGDIVFVELPELGTVVAQGDEVAAVESVKAASEIYAPVDGEVIAVNDELAGEPGLVNADPLGGGWFVKIRMSDPSQLDRLMDEDSYQDFIDSLQ